jgi:PKD repeat protein
MSIMNSFRQRGAKWHSTVVLALLIGPLNALPASAAPYQIIDLGTDVAPTDINNQGTVVGSRRTDMGNIAFRWSAATGIEDIVGATAAHAVNNELGQITGTTLSGAFLFDGTLQLWDGFGAYGINESGQISGNKQLSNPYRPTPLPLDPAVYTPDRWDNLGIATVYSRGTEQGVYADLYVLDDINDAGFAVGKRQRYGLVGSSAILTTPEFGDVTYLPIPNGGYAAAINNQNMVVGATGNNSTTDEYAHAYLYDYNTGTFQDLGTLNGGLTSSAADINERNQVVGTSWLVTRLTSLYDPTQYRAVIWDNGQIVDLNTLILSDSGWLLTSATAINDNGDIVGSGLKDGQVHGFLLSGDQSSVPVPPPAPNAAPVALASADVTRGKVPLVVNFSAADSHDPDGSIAGYAWDFGDGTLATDANPSHTYTVPGTYIAVLTVTDNQGLTAAAQVEITARKSNGKKR